MKIKFKMGDATVKFDYDFPKPNMNFYNKFFEKMPQNMAKYFNDLNLFFTKFMDFSEPDEIGKIPDDPDVFPVTGHDIFNYIARYGTGNFHSQAVLKFDGHLDFDILEKAVSLAVNAEPALGSKFVEGNPPYWRRIKDIDKIVFLTLENVTDVETAVKNFIESRLNMDKDPNLKLKIFRSETSDVLAIKVNHACCDGSGLKEIVNLLSDIYSNISGDNTEFILNSRVRGRNEQDTLFRTLGINNPDALLIPGADITIPTFSFPWKRGTSDSTRFVDMRFNTEQLETISRFAKSKGVTINDLIIAAYYRAMFKMGIPTYGVPMLINVTVDLRRYLPDKKTEALRNFSGSVNTSLYMTENETFSETLSKVSYIMNEIKKGYPGLQSAIGLERVEKISFKQTLGYYQITSRMGKKMGKSNPSYGDRCVPSISNLGILSQSLIKFGDITAVDYYIVPPVVGAPGVLMVANTYNGVFTLSVGYLENTVKHEDMEKLLNNIRDELLEGCKE